MSNETGGCGTCGDAKGAGSTLSAQNNSAPAERLGRPRVSSMLTDPVIVPYGQEPANIPVSFRSDQVLRGMSGETLGRLTGEGGIESSPETASRTTPPDNNRTTMPRAETETTVRLAQCHPHKAAYRLHWPAS